MTDLPSPHLFSKIQRTDCILVSALNNLVTLHIPDIPLRIIDLFDLNHVYFGLPLNFRI